MSEKAAPPRPSNDVQIDTDTPSKDGNISVEETSKKDAKSDQLPPVPFLQLFRFQTRLETTLNIIGLVAAAAAGAAQPLMSLLFGKLTQAFVEFGAAVSTGEDVTAAAQRFKDLAAKDALYIFVIGKYAILFIVCNTYNALPRRHRTGLRSRKLAVHGNLDIYWRSQC